MLYEVEFSFVLFALLALGAVHGINPAMGWLFAVSLGLQEGRRRAVWKALGPLALGHGLAVVVALAVAALLGRIVPLETVKWLVAIVLVGVGVSHLTRHRHPRWGGMRVLGRDLAIWSFLMASAHGAGLMVLPFVLSGGGSRDEGIAGSGGGEGVIADAVAHHAGHGALAAGPHGALAAGPHGALAAGPPAEWWTGLLGTAVHTGGYLLVTGLVAVVVYEWLGLRLLKKAWVNVDLLWAVALIATGVLTPFL